MIQLGSFPSRRDPIDKVTFDQSREQHAAPSCDDVLVSGCCEPQGYDRVFSTRQAERDAARFRRSGLSWAPRRTLELFRDGVLEGRTLLEVGGGIGDLQVELLRADVERAASVELSAGYEQAAARLLDDGGLRGRSTRLVGDFATRPELAEPADVVVMHSVVCCYPDAERLLTAAAARARRFLVLSYPRETWWLRAFAPLQNLYPRLRGSDFRFYVHPVAAIQSTVERAGLRQVHSERNWVDHLTIFVRNGPDS